MFVEQMRQLKIDQFALIALECALMTQLNASKYTSKNRFGFTMKTGNIHLTFGWYLVRHKPISEM